LRRELGLDAATGTQVHSGSQNSARGFLKHQRVVVFVDVQNMYYSARREFGQNLSYAMLLRKCVGNRTLVRAIAYLIERDGVNQTSFLNVLHYSGYEVRLRNKMEHGDGSSKAEWDVGMTLDMLKAAGKVDTIVVASGNGVFADVAPMIQARGTKFECCSFRQSVSKELLQAVDAYHFLDQEDIYQ